MKTTIKKLLTGAIIFATTAAFACWYNTTYYNDYIYGINNYENHTTAIANASNSSTTDYVVKNNMIVDFPLSISMKLAANTVEDSANLLANELNTVICMLQYRVLPDGEWRTVAYQEFAPNTISDDMPPAFWLGRNNINPSGLKEGDMIMVRLYVSRGMKESGMLDSKCDKTLNDNRLQSLFEYSINKSGIVEPAINNGLVDDLGGAWLPQNVVTLEFSGNYRPTR